MRLCFFVEYTSAWGEELCLSVGGDDRRVPMRWHDEQHWCAALEVDEPCVLEYRYVLNRLAERHPRRIYVTGPLTIHDTWIHPGNPANIWQTAPFRVSGRPGTSGFRLTHPAVIEPPKLPRVRCTFAARSPRPQLHLCGSIPQLGGWNTSAALPMQRLDDGSHRISIEVIPGTKISYKYCDGDLFEPGADRFVEVVSDAWIDSGFTRLPETLPKGAGVSVPVFSLRSEKSGGIGEFADIALLADWAQEAGLRMIQLLPVNDTTLHKDWTDSYPYAAISAFALHPVYMRLPVTCDLPGYEKRVAELNAAPLLDYEAVYACKSDALKTSYESFTPDDPFHIWTAANADWLEPYAAFCGRRDGDNDPGFYYFVQYFLHLQLSEAVAYAAAKGIAVKGDLPIGVSAVSADVLAAPGLFHTGMQAGAPPDEFSEQGQNWGFPTYNWPAMEAEGYAWWKRRLQHMAQYFAAFRIDHVLGFFRIWQIPRHARDGILGFFEPAIPFTEETLREKGIPYERSRYCEPYITDTLLEKLCGSNDMTKYLELVEQGRHPLHEGQGAEAKNAAAAPGRTAERRYTLREGWRTQAEIVAAGLDPVTEACLMRLTTEVLFLEPAPGVLHPRFNLHRTASFAALPEAIQQALKALSDHYFYERHDALWENEAMRKLPVLLQATDMLVCGEDLGMVPHCVPGVLERLGLLSLEVQRMPRIPSRRPGHAPYLSVVTPGTHDMTTLREHQPGRYRETAEEHLASPAMWCILQLQDWLAPFSSLPRLRPEEERINNPSVMPWYWRYRMPLTLEALLAAKEPAETIARMVRAAGR
ncbi:4-alpha-glucanotransferase [Chitinophaga lutea]